MPGKPYKSKLLPYESFIRRARSNGMFYKDIVLELKNRYALDTSLNNVFSFVKVRSKKKKVITMLEEDALNSTKENLLPGIMSKNLTKEENIQKQTTKTDEDDFIFDFNPDEPLY